MHIECACRESQAHKHIFQIIVCIVCVTKCIIKFLNNSPRVFVFWIKLDDAFSRLCSRASIYIFAGSLILSLLFCIAKLN